MFKLSLRCTSRRCSKKNPTTTAMFGIRISNFFHCCWLFGMKNFKSLHVSDILFVFFFLVRLSSYFCVIHCFVFCWIQQEIQDSRQLEQLPLVEKRRRVHYYSHTEKLAEETTTFWAGWLVLSQLRQSGLIEIGIQVVQW